MAMNFGHFGLGGFWADLIKAELKLNDGREGELGGSLGNNSHNNDTIQSLVISLVTAEQLD